MPRCASNSARCGPTPLIMRTSVLRFIAILIIFISSPLRTFGSGETCVSAPRIDRVRTPCPERGGSSDVRPSDRFRQARAAPLGGGGNSRGGVRLQVFFSRFPRSLRKFSGLPRRGAGARAEIRHWSWGERQRLPIHDCFQCRRQRQGLPRASARFAASEQAHVLRAEYLVLGRAFLQAATGRGI